MCSLLSWIYFCAITSWYETHALHFGSISIADRSRFSICIKCVEIFSPCRRLVVWLELLCYLQCVVAFAVLLSNNSGPSTAAVSLDPAAASQDIKLSFRRYALWTQPSGVMILIGLAGMAAALLTTRNVHLAFAITDFVGVWFAGIPHRVVCILSISSRLKQETPPKSAICHLSTFPDKRRHLGVCYYLFMHRGTTYIRCCYAHMLPDDGFVS